MRVYGDTVEAPGKDPMVSALAARFNLRETTSRHARQRRVSDCTNYRLASIKQFWNNDGLAWKAGRASVGCMCLQQRRPVTFQCAVDALQSGIAAGPRRGGGNFQSNGQHSDNERQ